MQGSQIAGGKWRPRKNIRETFMKDLEINELEKHLL